MQSGKVYRNKTMAGIISITDNGKYLFQYEQDYLNEPNSKSVSVNLPLQEEAFESEYLFPFFYNILSEGALKDLQCEKYKIDKDDDFSRLLKTTKENTIGSITIEENLWFAWAA